MANKVKKGLFIFIFGLLLLPLIEKNFTIIRCKQLYGWFTNAPDADFSWGKWWDGTYWEKKNSYLNDAIGFRPPLIRLNNQLSYSLFNKLRGPYYILGKNNCLFGLDYVESYFGKDYIGKSKIFEKLWKLRALQDTLERLGKSIIVVHAPSKAYFYPELIPEKYTHNASDSTNLKTFLYLEDSMGIHYINFNSWLVAQKNKSAETLYPLQGIHWSVYAAALAEDSFIKRIEDMRHIHMSHPIIKKIIHSYTPKFGDNDIAATQNLIFPVAHEVLSYPQIVYTKDKSIVKPKIVYIGDSFNFQWRTDGLMDSTNSDCEIWYYFKGIYGSNDPESAKKDPLTDADLANAFKTTDCFVLLYTPLNLYDFGSGFIERAYDYFYPANKY